MSPRPHLLLAALLLLAACDASDPRPDGPEITVLFAYTPAVAAATDVDALIDRTLRDTHAAYANSVIDVRLRRVHAVEVAYTLTERTQDLARLIAPDDGHLDEVHVLRDRHAADVVILIAEARSATINGAVLATPETAFAVVHYGTMAAPDYAFAHELGHLQGARHQPEADPSPEPFPYGHGLRTDAWKTIMSGGNVPAIPHFSNPEVTYQGTPTGTDSLHNVARVLNETAARIAAFR